MKNTVQRNIKLLKKAHKVLGSCETRSQYDVAVAWLALACRVGSDLVYDELRGLWYTAGMMSVAPVLPVVSYAEMKVKMVE